MSLASESFQRIRDARQCDDELEADGDASGRRAFGSPGRSTEELKIRAIRLGRGVSAILGDLAKARVARAGRAERQRQNEARTDRLWFLADWAGRLEDHVHRSALCPDDRPDVNKIPGKLHRKALVQR